MHPTLQWFERDLHARAKLITNAAQEPLVALGRHEEGRALFENLLGCRNRHGLLAEHIDPVTRELWGNFPQTYSMVGLIKSATRLSIPWQRAF